MSMTPSFAALNVVALFPAKQDGFGGTGEAEQILDHLAGVEQFELGEVALLVLRFADAVEPRPRRQRFVNAEAGRCSSRRETRDRDSTRALVIEKAADFH